MEVKYFHRCIPACRKIFRSSTEQHTLVNGRYSAIHAEEVKHSLHVRIEAERDCLIDVRIMSEGKFVIRSERFDERHQCPEVFMLVVSADRHSRLEFFDRLRRAFENVKLGALDIEFDEVYARQLMIGNVRVERDDFCGIAAVRVQVTAADVAVNVSVVLLAIERAESEILDDEALRLAANRGELVILSIHLERVYLAPELGKHLGSVTVAGSAVDQYIAVVGSEALANILRSIGEDPIARKTPADSLRQSTNCRNRRVRAGVSCKCQTRYSDD